VRLRVADTGTGMDPATQDRAFEPFFTTKPLGKAGGMGLSVVYGIVSGSGGDVEIVSTPGSGTTVTIHLPATEEPPPPPAAPPASQRAEGEERTGGTILLVDDEPDLRDATRRLLERAGYRVLSAGNGAEAIELAGAYPGTIDMLLTDVAMPGMLGRELAHRLTGEQPSLRVLFMSGYAQALLSANGNLDPDVELLQKPFDKAALLDKVAEMISQ
jgi:two-component system, cell cycle sensor histidine kinase and response regulator CckA